MTDLFILNEKNRTADELNKIYEKMLEENIVSEISAYEAHNVINEGCEKEENKKLKEIGKILLKSEDEMITMAYIYELNNGIYELDNLINHLTRINDIEEYKKRLL